MQVFIEKDDKKLNIKFSGKAFNLLSKLKINPDEVLLVKNGELITEEDSILDKDFIRILSVISGG